MMSPRTPRTPRTPRVATSKTGRLATAACLGVFALAVLLWACIGDLLVRSELVRLGGDLGKQQGPGGEWGMLEREDTTWRPPARRQEEDEVVPPRYAHQLQREEAQRKEGGGGGSGSGWWWQRFSDLLLPPPPLPPKPLDESPPPNDFVQALAVPRVALLFLTTGEMAHEATWADWLAQAEGLVPTERLRLACGLMQGPAGGAAEEAAWAAGGAGAAAGRRGGGVHAGGAARAARQRMRVRVKTRTTAAPGRGLLANGDASNNSSSNGSNGSSNNGSEKHDKAAPPLPPLPLADPSAMDIARVRSLMAAGNPWPDYVQQLSRGGSTGSTSSSSGSGNGGAGTGAGSSGSGRRGGGSGGGGMGGLGGVGAGSGAGGSGDSGGGGGALRAPHHRQFLFSVYVHVPPGFKRKMAPGGPFATRVIAPRIRSPRFSTGLVEAARALVGTALANWLNQRFVLLSDATLPLYPPGMVYLQLMSEPLSRANACPEAVIPEHVLPERSYIRAVQPNPKFWRKHSQWVSLNRRTAEALVEEARVIRRMTHCREETQCAPDEHYIGTWMVEAGLSNESSCSWGTTYSEWGGDAAGHPTTFRADRVTRGLVRTARECPTPANASMLAASAYGFVHISFLGPHTCAAQADMPLLPIEALLPPPPPSPSPANAAKKGGKSDGNGKDKGEGKGGKGEGKEGKDKGGKGKDKPSSSSGRSLSSSSDKDDSSSSASSAFKPPRGWAPYPPMDVYCALFFRKVAGSASETAHGLLGGMWRAGERR